TCNKNGVPFDPKPPATTSGVRLGSPAGTTRGFKAAEFTWIGTKIVEVLDALKGTPDGNPEVEARVRGEVRAMCARFPIY
ncbi:MAG: serine hydroxymethyltransferase, partial [Pseudomonadota bacterium]